PWLRRVVFEHGCQRLEILAGAREPRQADDRQCPVGVPLIGLNVQPQAILRANRETGLHGWSCSNGGRPSSAGIGQKPWVSLCPDGGIACGSLLVRPDHTLAAKRKSGPGGGGAAPRGVAV